MYNTYILKSFKDGRYYYGSTSNIGRRLSQHNDGKVLSTKSRIPFKLVYSEKYKSKKDALKREMFFKKRSGYRWLKLNNII